MESYDEAYDSDTSELSLLAYSIYGMTPPLTRKEKQCAKTGIPITIRNGQTIKLIKRPLSSVKNVLGPTEKKQGLTHKKKFTCTHSSLRSRVIKTAKKAMRRKKGTVDATSLVLPKEAEILACIDTLYVRTPVVTPEKAYKAKKDVKKDADKNTARKVAANLKKQRSHDNDKAVQCRLPAIYPDPPASNSYNITTATTSYVLPNIETPPASYKSFKKAQPVEKLAHQTNIRQIHEGRLTQRLKASDNFTSGNKNSDPNRLTKKELASKNLTSDNDTAGPIAPIDTTAKLNSQLSNIGRFPILPKVRGASTEPPEIETFTRPGPSAATTTPLPGLQAPGRQARRKVNASKKVKAKVISRNTIQLKREVREAKPTPPTPAKKVRAKVDSRRARLPKLLRHSGSTERRNSSVPKLVSGTPTTETSQDLTVPATQQIPAKPPGLPVLKKHFSRRSKILRKHSKLMVEGSKPSHDVERYSTTDEEEGLCCLCKAEAKNKFD